jgi:hypothetical protein
MGRFADAVMRVVPLDLPMTEETMSLITGWQGTRDDLNLLGITCRPVAETMSDAVRTWFASGLLTAKEAGLAANGAHTGPADPL